MADWTDWLSATEARAILDAKVKTRFPARNERGEKVMRYTALTADERAKVEARANG